MGHAESIAEAFCTLMEKFGWFVGVYASLSVWRNNLGTTAKRFTPWLAEWEVSKQSMAAPLWQYTANGRVNGITGPVDMDNCDDTLADIVMNSGKNNISKPAPTKHTVALMVDGQEVYKGEF